MNNTYNANIYLTKSDLNTIENQIETLTEEIQEKIFDNTTSPLRNIQVGDDLNKKTLYCFFPNNINESISEGTTSFITTDNNNHIVFTKVIFNEDENSAIGCVYNNDAYPIYRKYYSDFGFDMNIRKFKLPYDFGIVTTIDTENDIYQYIKIYDDERIIPNYVKHTWVDNEFLSMQKIDNIGQGIKNIGEYYYKPQGWLNPREWLKLINFIDVKDKIVDDKFPEEYRGLNIQNISYSDLNRWVNDLDLIDFDNLNDLTIWNSDISQLNWNETSDIDWEEL